MDPNTNQIIVIGLLLCAAIIAVHFVTAKPAKPVKIEPDTALSRLEAHYFEDEVYNQQLKELAATNAEVETEALRKGIIESI